MAKSVLLQQFVSINAVDLSTYTYKGEASFAAESQETTTYGSVGHKEFLGGLKSGKLDLSFRQDFAVGLIDQLMFALLGTVVAFDVRANNAARSTSNPSFTGFVLITEWNPITGSVGDVATVSVSYPTTGVFNRLTA